MSKVKKPKRKLNKVESLILDYLTIAVGAFIFAVGMHCFTAPNQMAPGGVTGIATIVNYAAKVPIGLITVLINVPIMIFGFWHLGKKFMFKSIFSVISFTVFIDYVLAEVPVYTNDKILASIFGGVMMGIGIGLQLTRGGSSGGMDIVNKIISKRVPHIKLGQIIFASDLVIVTISIFVFKSVEPALYALVALYISSVSLDMVLYGFNVCKFVYIISEKAPEISKCIIEELHRGATILESTGAYTGEKRPTVMVAIRQNEYYMMKKIIARNDPDAFVIVTSATEIMGVGFTPYE